MELIWKNLLHANFRCGPCVALRCANVYPNVTQTQKTMHCMPGALSR